MKENMKDKFDHSACFDDVLYRQTFAHNYNLDSDKDLDLLKKIHSITTVRRVYDANKILPNLLLNTLMK